MLIARSFWPRALAHIGLDQITLRVEKINISISVTHLWHWLGPFALRNACWAGICFYVLAFLLWKTLWISSYAPWGRTGTNSRCLWIWDGRWVGQNPYALPQSGSLIHGSSRLLITCYMEAEIGVLLACLRPQFLLCSVSACYIYF